MNSLISRIDKVKMAIAIMIILIILVGAGNLTATYQQGQQIRDQQAQQDAKDKAQTKAQREAQRAAGAALERKLCTTLGPLAVLATLKPPAGNPRDNPSRAYEQRLAAAVAPLAQLGPDLGCPAENR